MRIHRILLHCGGPFDYTTIKLVESRRGTASSSCGFSNRDFHGGLLCLFDGSSWKWLSFFAELLQTRKSSSWNKRLAYLSLRAVSNGMYIAHGLSRAKIAAQTLFRPSWCMAKNNTKAVSLVRVLLANHGLVYTTHRVNREGPSTPSNAHPSFNCRVDTTYKYVCKVGDDMGWHRKALGRLQSDK